MTEKQIIAETRLIRLDWWLRRQPFNATFNRKVEAAEAFKKRLKTWSDSQDFHLVAPSFHLASL